MRGDWAAAAMLAGRVLAVAALVPNGLRKIVDFTMVAGMMGGAAPVLLDGRLFPPQPPLVTFPVPEAFLAGSILLDIGGSLAIAAGAWTRPVAAALFVYCVAAIAIYHGNIGGPDDVKAIVRSLPLLGCLLVVAGAGAGAWSVDGWRGRARSL